MRCTTRMHAESTPSTARGFFGSAAEGVRRMTRRMTPALDLEFTPEPSVIRTARDAVGIFSQEIPQEELDDLRLVVSELMAKSLRHAAFTSEDRIRLRVTRWRNVVRGEVSDPGHDLDAPPTLGDSSGSGRGLFFVDRLSDRWGVVNDGERIQVWFELDP